MKMKRIMKKQHNDNNLKKTNELMHGIADICLKGLKGEKITEIGSDLELGRIIEYAVKSQMPYLMLSPIVGIYMTDDYRNVVKSLLVKSTMNSLAQVCAVKELEKALESEGVKFQFLKGTILKKVYPSPEMREMSDIDVMIYDPSLDKAEEVVKKLGYELVGSVKHHVIYKKDPFIVLEVHWSLYDKNVDRSQYLYFNDSSRAVPVEGKKYSYEYTKEDFYVYMIAHIGKHFYENGCGIRNLLDIYIYIEKYKNILDRKRIREGLETCGLLSFERYMRSLAYIWLEKKEADEFFASLFDYMLGCGIYGKGENGIWGQLAKQATENDNLRKKYYFPDAGYMKENYPWLEGKEFLLPVAWGIRAAKGISNGAGNRNEVLTNTDISEQRKILNIYKRLELNFKK